MTAFPPAPRAQSEANLPTPLARDLRKQCAPGPPRTPALKTPTPGLATLRRAVTPSSQHHAASQAEHWPLARARGGNDASCSPHSRTKLPARAPGYSDHCRRSGRSPEALTRVRWQGYTWSHPLLPQAKAMRRGRRMRCWASPHRHLGKTGRRRWVPAPGIYCRPYDRPSAASAITARIGQVADTTGRQVGQAGPGLPERAFIVFLAQEKATDGQQLLMTAALNQARCDSCLRLSVSPSRVQVGVGGYL